MLLQVCRERRHGEAHPKSSLRHHRSCRNWLHSALCEMYNSPLMPKRPRLRTHWDIVHPRIEFYPPDQLRQFFAASAKFLIKRRYWDDQPPRTGFDHEASIRTFHEGFVQFSKEEMLCRRQASHNGSDFITLLKRASGWAGQDFHRRVAKRKLTRLRKEIKKRLKRHASIEEQPLRGLIFYERVIRKMYLMKQRSLSNSSDSIST